eukprot:CAMPEP_0185276278 /NCGR_PEP_ID=MMETSP1359-20130426/55860_1 /TAXON_ID=552665 /ORGANISM="Bigelowiella longifila, Strain CCMP242" /LENGTH=414 /DNA_ID=CAMNT_0027869897 /DNA_START=125 /DNA_END=1369 /DNA_ORIENTATION=-
MYYLALVFNLFCCFATAEKLALKPTLESFWGCALLVQSWFPALINVGGVLWQIAVFAFGYALFPAVSRAAKPLGLRALLCGMLSLYIFSAGYFIYLCVAAVDESKSNESSEAMNVTTAAWIWHVHCIARLPQFVAGVCLGEVVERLRITGMTYEFNAVTAFTVFYSEGEDGGASLAARRWSLCADWLSVFLLATALLSPLIRAYFGTSARDMASIGLEAFLLPLHALWLAAIVFAYHRRPEQGDVGRWRRRPLGRCYTREVLSWKPLVFLGDISLAIYCLHIPVLFVYTMAVAYVATGDWRLTTSIDDVDLRVRASYIHMPLQWSLVLAVSFAANKLFEQPLRKLIISKSLCDTDGALRRANNTAAGRNGEEREGKGEGQESPPLLSKQTRVGDADDRLFGAESMSKRVYGTYD